MSPPPLPSIPPGALAAVRWTDGHFYLVRLLQSLPGGSRFQFSNGEIETAPQASLVQVPSQPAFRIGDQVLAVWKTDRMFPGTVTAITAKGYTVAWHDGDAPLVVPAGMLTSLAWANRAVMAPNDRGAAGWVDVTKQVLPQSGNVNRAVPPPLPQGLTPKSTRLTVFIPGHVMPTDRGIRFVEPLEDALRRGNLGEVVDEGTELVQGSARPSIRGCWISIDATDAANALVVIRRVLKSAGAPPDTTITQHEPQQRIHSLGG
jgi:hypothetical protein